MAANQGSRNSSNSWSCNFRFIHMYTRLAAFALMAAILLAPGQSRAQTQTYNWSTGYINVGADCIIPNSGGTWCSSAEASCQSYAAAAGFSPDYFLTPTDSNRMTCWYTFLG